jgi:methylenetetrahydrofolate reductase (NADPH)
LNTFETALNTRDFVITSELILGSQSGDEDIRLQADVLRDHVDAVLVTDNQSGRLHMSSLAASVLLLQEGIDPIMQLGCRNRNRVALLGDLLGATTLGIRSLQIVRGERVPDGFKPRPNAMLDVTATELIEMANKMKLGEGIVDFPELMLGGVATPRKPRPNWAGRKLLQKVDAGARFLLTHACMNIDILDAFLQRLVALKVTHRASIIATIAVLGSAQDARWLRENQPNVTIPKAIVERLEKSSDPRGEGIRIAAEMLQRLARIPGLSGAHLYSAGDLRAVAEAIEASGLRSGAG